MVQTYTASKRVGELDLQVSQLEMEFNKILQEKEYKETDEFVEKEARNKLQLIKPGESVVVIDRNQEAVLGVADENPRKDISLQDQWAQLLLSGLRL